MRFFFDNCISPKLARAIHCLVEPKNEVFHLKDLFREDVADVDWIEQLGDEGDWVVISGDLQSAEDQRRKRFGRKRNSLPSLWLRGLQSAIVGHKFGG